MSFPLETRDSGFGSGVARDRTARAQVRAASRVRRGPTESSGRIDACAWSADARPGRPRRRRPVRVDRRLCASGGLGVDVARSGGCAGVVGNRDAGAGAGLSDGNGSSAHRPLEEAWLLRELVEVHGENATTLAVSLQRSASWISRRLALVRVLPESVQSAVRRGQLPPQAAMKSLVPLARANRTQCEDLGIWMPRDGLDVSKWVR